jgi:hypothetical protein
MDEEQQRLKVYDIYTLIYAKNVQSIEDACKEVGISKATFYNWDERLREEERLRVFEDQRKLRVDRQEAIERAKADAELTLINDGVRILLASRQRIENIILNSRSDFNSIAAYKEIRDDVRNGLKADKGKTIIFEGKSEEIPAALPAPEPTRWLPPPDAVTAATDLRLASEVQTTAKFPDGSQLETKLTRPDVVDG